MFNALRFLVVAICICYSCKSSKYQVQDDSVSGKNKINSKVKVLLTQTLEERLLEEGFVFGTIKRLENLECDYIIQKDDSNLQYDPINFSYDVLAEFKVDGLKVYFKFTPLRMMNRCTDAMPIELESIKKRKE